MFHFGTDLAKNPPSAPWKPLSVGYVLSEEHSVDHDKYSRFSGSPTHENTKAWEDLIQRKPTFFAATDHELRAGGETIDDAVRVADTDGYLAALGVYHELHCLRQLRLHLYRDVYFTNLTEANLQWFYDHLDHCIETLRISIMCQADLSLYTFKWDSNDEYRPHAKSNSKRMCVNWDEVERWSSERKVSLWPRLIRKGGSSEKIHL
ncbi:uncharacterized protein CC84DRAFT_1220740 [Paraphaeosphaeria sporulosa]|uniref:Tat pathway signal sequence n=1 Tax=Paraphaeosphaeria sporulosa TaxID=1460663 RepID=A0A177C3U9_9PLEO|nr:uncharacterized protein CC84DRAFT_1220740 [Paraphaeosphaeria sporulosa]OAG02414.1 hypothetical protein CC84DRAFT_1220740 [Paraphaeosphaeria sporulosa]